jgi:hypothetical protein
MGGSTINFELNKRSWTKEEQQTNVVAENKEKAIDHVYKQYNKQNSSH